MAASPLQASVILDHLNGRSGGTAYLVQPLDQARSLGRCPVNLLMPTLDCGRTIAGQKGLRKGLTLSYTDVTIAAVALEFRIPC